MTGVGKFALGLMVLIIFALLGACVGAVVQTIRRDSYVCHRDHGRYFVLSGCALPEESK